MGDSDTIFISEKNMKFILEYFQPRQKAFGRSEMILEKNIPEDRLCLLLKGTAYLCMENERGDKQLLDYFTGGCCITICCPARKAATVSCRPNIPASSHICPARN